jgi:exosortase/archaeosortase family protein
MQEPAAIRSHQHRLRFLLLFLVAAGSLAVVFGHWQVVFDWGYLYPVSRVTAFILDLVGVELQLDVSSVSLGYCLLIFQGITLRVIHECTGIFALLILLAALLAYPARAIRKAWGGVWCISAFFAYSSLRLVLLGLIAHFRPEWIQFFHRYLIVLLNFGFVLSLWTIWVNGTRCDD